MMLEAEVDEAINCFADSLADLTVNSKPLINFLTMVAKENLERADIIVDAVVSHLKKAPTVVKLPILYLIDSIVKNVATKYIDLFSTIIKENFAKIYAEADLTMRQSMFKLRQTWDEIFPTKDLCALDIEIHSFDSTWTLKGESLDAFKNKLCKILLNPSFLPMESAEAVVDDAEVDEAEMLREQLLLQKRKRDLEKEQIQLDQHISKQKSSTNQADSTTIENSTRDHPPDDIIPVNQASPTDLTVQSQKDNLKLIDLFSDLLSRQNCKPLKDSEAHDHGKQCSSLKYPRSKSHRRNPSYDDVRRKSYRYSKYSNHRSHRERDRRSRRDSYIDRKPQHTDVLVHGRDDASQTHVAAGNSSKLSQVDNGSDNFSKYDVSHWKQASVNLTSSKICTKTAEITPPFYLNTNIQTVIEESRERRTYSNIVHIPNSLKRKFTPAAVCSDSVIDLVPSFEVLNSGMVSGGKQKTALLPTPLNEAAPLLSVKHTQISHEFSKSIKLSEKLVDITQERIFDYKHGYGMPEKRLETCTSFNQVGNFEPQCYQNQIAILQEPLQDDFKLEGKYSALSLPPACLLSLQSIAQDPMGTISVDGIGQDVRYYGHTAVIGAGSDNPREILFKPGKASIILNNFVVHCAFHEPNKEIMLMGKCYRLRLGAPTRELYVNNEGFQCSFNCPPNEFQLSTGEVFSARLQCSAVPLVHIGALRRDLVAGSVTLSVNGVNVTCIFLDGKPQRFYIAGIPHILKFSNCFKTILINDQIVNISFGGPAIGLLVQAEVHYVKLSHLPPGLVLGQFSVQGVGFPQQGQNPILQNLGVEGHFAKSSSYLPFPQNERTARGKGRKRSENNVKARRLASCQLATRIREQTKLNGTGTEGSPDVMSISSASSITTLPTSTLTVYPNEPVQNSTHKLPAFEPCANIHALFQNLCDVGLLTPHKLQTELEDGKAIREDICEVDFSESSSLKQKQPGLVDVLYSGVQCSSCGERFFPDESGTYRKHLDWHFQINHEIRKPQSRLWYLKVKDWIHFEPEVNMAQEVIPEECKGSKPIPEELISSVPSQDYPYGMVCEVCRDKFDEYFNEEQDEWHLKDCICNEGLVYHPVCLKDYQMTSDAAVNKRLQLLEDELSKESFQSDSKVNKAVSPTNVDNTTEAQNLKSDQVVLPDNLVEKNIKINDNYCFTKEVENTKLIFPACESDSKDSTDDTHKISILPPQTECGSASVVPDCEVNSLSVKNTNMIENCLTKETETTKCLSFPVLESDDKSSAENLKSNTLLPEPKACVVLKSRLVGRKLTQLPPLAKGSDISNMCTVT